MGSLLHPTTNRSTLGKTISNGCVGMSEADAWVVYYYAPLGTKVRFRYDLDVVGPDGRVRRLEDVYAE
ncbi:MAG: L,D-transpeptidase family protein [Flavobacteriales bacterium]